MCLLLISKIHQLPPTQFVFVPFLLCAIIHVLAVLVSCAGYRGAQCGWLLVSDPVKEDRHTQCLCVYLPRRGIIEVQFYGYT